MDRYWEFALLGGVSIKALRFYAELELLPPAAIKPESRYRLYTKSQLSRLHRILLLKNAGFTLAEIRGQLAHRDESALQQIRARLVERAEEIQRQLSLVDAEMRSSSLVVIKQVPKLAVWSRRQQIESYDEADVLLRDLRRTMPAQVRLTAGAIWHDCGQRSGRIDCEVFWLSRGRARTPVQSELHPATMASILHESDESTIGVSYEAAHRWIRDNRFQIAGPNREIYLGGSLTEIQVPIN